MLEEISSGSMNNAHPGIKDITAIKD